MNPQFIQLHLLSKSALPLSLEAYFLGTVSVPLKRLLKNTMIAAREVGRTKESRGTLRFLQELSHASEEQASTEIMARWEKRGWPK